MTLYEYLQEIKTATGWSQESLSAETGLGLSTISRIFRVPGYEPSVTTVTLIRRLHEEVVHQPFPSYLEDLIHLIDFHKERESRRDYEVFLNIQENLLVNNTLLEQADTPAACRIAWILGHISFDRAFYLRTHVEDAAATAKNWYEKALDILETVADETLNLHKYKLQQCIVAVKFNLLPPGERAKDAGFRQNLQDMKYLELVTAIAKEYPWHWMAIRNGLIAASLLEDKNACTFFWDALKNANKRFAEPDYSPGQHLPALNDDPDLAWFRQMFIK